MVWGAIGLSKMEENRRIKGICNCGEPATCMIRTRKVCKRCFKIYREDNHRRLRRGIDIPDKLEVLE